MNYLLYPLLSLMLISCASKRDGIKSFPLEEKHIKNVKQLTWGGENAEAYFSKDSRWLIFQSKRGKSKCDQQYVMRTDGSDLRMVSTGKGRVTCGYFTGDTRAEDSGIIYSSTHDHDPNCPELPKANTRGYFWPIFPSYEIYTDSFRGKNLKRLTDNNYYDAEATVSPDGKKVVFTSTRDGDLDLYVMNVDGSNVKRITKTLGYDGGAFFTHDGKKLIYRAYHPKSKKEKARYLKNLREHRFSPAPMELYLVNIDGTKRRRITKLQASSFAPYMFKNDKRVIFSTNVHDPKKRNFDLFAVDINGKKLEQITFNPSFDAFPMFSPKDGKIVWSSNRNGAKRGETNIFIADWVN